METRQEKVFCPDTETKECIKSHCIAYKSNYKPYLWKCKDCGKERYLGGYCDCYISNPMPIKTFNYCERYNKEIKEII
jgi:hypothetical protein